MNEFIDQAARILATPMPRRKALGMLWTVAAGAVMAVAFATPAAAQGRGSNGNCSGQPCKGQSGGRNKCCSSGTGNYQCVREDQYCCGNKYNLVCAQACLCPVSTGTACLSSCT